MANRYRNTDPVAQYNARQALRNLKPRERAGSLSASDRQQLKDARAVLHWRSTSSQQQRFGSGGQYDTRPGSTRGSSPSGGTKRSGGASTKQRREALERTGFSSTSDVTAYTRGGKAVGGHGPIRKGPQGWDIQKDIRSIENADEVNRQVNRMGGTLKRTKGSTVIGYVDVNLGRAVTDMGYMKGGRSGYHEARTEKMPVYSKGSTSSGPARRPTSGSSSGYTSSGGSRGGGRSGSRSGGGGGSRGGGGGKDPYGRLRGRNSRVNNNTMRDARVKAENHLHGRTNKGQAPDLFPEGYKPGEGSAVEQISNYGNKLDTYNQNQIGYMNDRAVATQYETGQILRTVTKNLPPAPKPLSEEDIRSNVEFAAGLLEVPEIDFSLPELPERL